MNLSSVMPFDRTQEFCCAKCRRTFKSKQALQQHKIDVHLLHRKFSSYERPMNRGDVPCGHPGCAASFKNERNAQQHRRDKHE